MWVKPCHKPPMTGNGKHTTYNNGEIGDGKNGIVLPTVGPFLKDPFRSPNSGTCTSQILEDAHSGSSFVHPFWHNMLVPLQFDTFS